MDPILQWLLSKLTGSKEKKTGEQVIAEMPGVGQGYLDTLRSLTDKPLAFDTLSEIDIGGMRQEDGSWKKWTMPNYAMLSDYGDTVYINPKMPQLRDNLLDEMRRANPIEFARVEGNPKFGTMEHILPHELGHRFSYAQQDADAFANSVLNMREGHDNYPTPIKLDSLRPYTREEIRPKFADPTYLRDIQRAQTKAGPDRLTYLLNRIIFGANRNGDPH